MNTPSGKIDIRTLVDQHYELIYRYAYRLSGSAAAAEDLTQETFCTAQQKLGQLRDPNGARGWLCTIVRNHFLLGRRHERTVGTISLEASALEPAQPELDSVEIDTDRLQRVLNELPEGFRNVVILYYFEEFSYRQIAEQMAIPIGTVMSRLARAKAYLRVRLGSASVCVLPRTTLGS
jgi:RNA polymerase sigma-70 factor (ECF subfamily)